MKLVFVQLLLLVVNSGAAVKVAVYEHVVISPDHPEGQFTREEAYQWMLKNLQVFRAQARIAADQGAKIIVFPEYGITGFDHSRDSIVPFLEDVPDISIDWNPCNDPTRFNNTKVLNYLSCSAQTANIYIAVNMGDIKSCTKTTHSLCPDDNRFQFNTNVVFDNMGRLVSRYHKRNLYDESPLFDPSPTLEYSYFETPFGKFGNVICFDLLHYYPTQELIKNFNISNLLVTSAWNVFYPFIFPIQMYAGIAKRNNLNVIAANIRNADNFMASSGIFGPDTEASTDTNFSNDQGQLLVTDLNTDVITTTPDKTLEPLTTLDKLKTMTNKTYQGINSHFNFSILFTLLSEKASYVSLCTKHVCCAADYELKEKDSSELIVLSAADAKLYYPGRINMQYCAIHSCPSQDITSCGQPTTFTKSTFAKLKVQAYFDHYVTFPLVSSSPYGNESYHSERKNYKFDKEQDLIEGSSFTYPLLTAVVFNSAEIKDITPEPSSKASNFHTRPTLVLLVSLLVLSNIIYPVRLSQVESS